jgi:anhydro-N-acetylmuramic acid kinase
MTIPTGLYIGLMSGTSLDGIDGVLADFSAPHPHTLAFAHEPYDAATRAELLALQVPCDNELHRAMMMSNAMAEGYAVVVSELLARAKLTAQDITAIGAHGQTIRHQPNAKPNGYTVQLLNAALLVERVRIAVVSNFRARDIAASGQGAPLVPAFHAARFGGAGNTQVICNIGGIANITVLRSQKSHSSPSPQPSPADAGEGVKMSSSIIGFDTGPGNCLMDMWAVQHIGTPYDAHGEFAAKGKVHAALLEDMLHDDYFYAPPPKSTGRDLFCRAWLDAKLSEHAKLAKPADVQATLTELTARSICDAVREHAADATQLWLCGGGAFNRTLVHRIAQLLPQCKVAGTSERGVPEQQVEALAFAWLAQQHLLRKPANLPAVTGALRVEIAGDYTPTL